MGDAALKMDETVVAKRNHFAANITALWHRSREGIIAIGRALIEAKAQLEHGEFTLMIEADLPFSPETARRFMRIASDPKLSNHPNSDVLPTSAEALDTLQRLSTEQFQAGVASGAIHPNMTIKNAVELVQEIGRNKDGYRDHRPIAATTQCPRQPPGGIAHDYLELVWMLTEERKRQGITQEELDDRCGLQDGYCGKLEQPQSLYGRRAVNPTFDLWLGGLKGGLLFVPHGFKVTLTRVDAP